MQEAMLAALPRVADGRASRTTRPPGWSGRGPAPHRRLAQRVVPTPARGPVRPVEPADVPDGDDSLELLLLCCHPALTLPSQVALTLRAVGGLTTDQIARGFLVPTSTIGQRISRAKASSAAPGPASSFPPARRCRPGSRPSRRSSTSSSPRATPRRPGRRSTAGTSPTTPYGSTAAPRARTDRSGAGPAAGRGGGLLALMLLSPSRRAARVGPDGELVPLAEQDRGLWDRALIDEGVALITAALSERPLGPYQLQAAIAAVHAEAASAADTDWREILGLYDLLVSLAPSPMTRLNRVVALAMAVGPEWRSLNWPSARSIRPGSGTTGSRRSAHTCSNAGAPDDARLNYLEAARLTSSDPEQRYLLQRAARVHVPG